MKNEMIYRLKKEKMKKRLLNDSLSDLLKDKISDNKINKNIKNASDLEFDIILNDIRYNNIKE